MRTVPSPIHRLHVVDPGIDTRGANSKTEGHYQEQQYQGSKKEKTLYEVLRSHPTASRNEIRRQFAVLARETHPDALTSGEGNAAFTEVSHAWNVLGNEKERRRYDRSLQAAEIKENVEKLAFQVGKTTGPAARKIFEDVALPFMKRTTATTMATFTAVASDISKSNSSGVDLVGHAVNAGLKAGVAASQILDAEELQAKGEELEKRAKKEVEKAMSVQEKLAAVMDQRLSLALRTPKSNITSSEALRILDSFNTVDSVSIGDMVRMRRTIQRGIESLETAETDYYEKAGVQQLAFKDITEYKQSLGKAEIAAAKATEAEAEAIRVLEACRKRVAETTHELDELNRVKSGKQNNYKKAILDAQKASTSLGRRQEKVRKALKEKREALREQKMAKSEKLEPDLCDGLKEADLEALQRKEQKLLSECTRVESQASRLQSRAKKLLTRAEEIRQIRKQQKRQMNGQSM